MKYLLILFFILSLITGCMDHHHHSLMDKLSEQDITIKKVESDQISKTRLDEFKYQKSIWEKKDNFHVLERFSEFKEKKCQECHSSKLKIPSQASNHNEIKLQHAGKDTMNCTTCHADKETWKLHMLEGEKVSMNHVYKLCSQCHFQQVDDWANGAHGKRVGGWHGKRVIKNCTDCHNPHKPQFHKQMPKVTPSFLQFKK